MYRDERKPSRANFRKLAGFIKLEGIDVPRVAGRPNWIDHSILRNHLPTVSMGMRGSRIVFGVTQHSSLVGVVCILRMCAVIAQCTHDPHFLIVSTTGMY